MESTLKAGDVLIISKLNYGPRVPTSIFEYPWIGNILNYFKASDHITINSPKRTKWIFSGITKPQTGDIIVFEHPKSLQLLVKRNFGAPGDTIQISSGRVLINSELIPEEEGVKLKYQLVTNNSLDTLIQFMDNQEVEFLRQTQVASEIQKKLIHNQPELSKTIFPYNERYNWSPDNYGPILIPYEGMSIKTSDNNFHYYFEIIRDSEFQEIIYHQDRYYISGRLITSYTFTRNYYFALGDNRYNSADSRYFGLIPENLIEGKVIYSSSMHD